MNHQDYMAFALQEAEIAFLEGEIPVGAVIVSHGEIIARAHNNREQTHSPLGHAEIQAIEAASRLLGDWRLDECSIYVTLEPCVMCAGAIINSRIKEVIYGAPDPKAGCFGSHLNLAHLKLGHSPRIIPNIEQEKCQQLLQQFFQHNR